LKRPHEGIEQRRILPVRIVPAQQPPAIGGRRLAPSGRLCEPLMRIRLRRTGRSRTRLRYATARLVNVSVVLLPTAPREHATRNPGTGWIRMGDEPSVGGALPSRDWRGGIWNIDHAHGRYASGQEKSKRHDPNPHRRPVLERVIDSPLAHRTARPAGQRVSTGGAVKDKGEQAKPRISEWKPGLRLKLGRAGVIS
jgi:hypothetical protein